MHRGFRCARAFALFVTPATALCLACSPDGGSFVEGMAAPIESTEPRAATKPTGSQDCNPAGKEVLRLSLQQEGDFSRFLRVNDSISLRLETDVESGGTLTLQTTVTSVDAEAVGRVSNYSVPRHATELTVSLPVSVIDPPTHGLAVSRQLIIHARLAADGGRYEAAREVRLYFHPQDDGWEFYDAVVRDRDYSGGALTEAERAKRAAAIESLPPGTTAEYVGARSTKLSDDPGHIPPDDATMEGTP